MSKKCPIVVDCPIFEMSHLYKNVSLWQEMSHFRGFIIHNGISNFESQIPMYNFNVELCSPLKADNFCRPLWPFRRLCVIFKVCKMPLVSPRSIRFTLLKVERRCHVLFDEKHFSFALSLSQLGAKRHFVSNFIWCIFSLHFIKVNPDEEGYFFLRWKWVVICPDLDTQHSGRNWSKRVF